MSIGFPPTSATSRFLKAYATAIIVLGSYWWLSVKSKFFDVRYREEKIHRVHERNAKRIENTILSLQGLFIKVGQLFSIMTNFLPETFRTGLENLQDSVPSKPYPQISAQIVEELGEAPEKIFATFDTKPIASASLGQVHKATTKNGDTVAVKVQHMGVEKMAQADLRTIWRILQLVKRFVKVRGLNNYYHEIKAMILEELDFEKEGNHIKTISQNFEDNDRVVFPDVYKELSTKRILTLGYIDGIKITSTDELKEAGVDPSEIASDLVTVYCQMIFKDGIYHADPHPGNILVLNDGKLALLDFGAVGHLESDMRSELGTFIEAIIKGDEEQLLHSLKKMGFLRIGTDQTEAATRVIEHFHRKFQEEIRLKDFSFSSVQIDTSMGLEHLSDLWKMDVGLREISTAFHMPREWVLLERTALLLTGICTHLDPSMNPTTIIRPYLEKFVLGEDRDWSQMLFDLTREKVLSFLSLPKLFDKYVNRALQGQITVRIGGLNSAATLIYLATQQLTFALLSGASAGVAIYLHHIEELKLAKYCAYGAAGFIVLMLISMLRSQKHRR